MFNVLYLKQRSFCCFLDLEGLCSVYSKNSLANRSQNTLDEMTKYCKCVAVIVKLCLLLCTICKHTVVDVKIRKVF